MEYRDRFRLPDSFGQASDPIEENPFPPSAPGHPVWAEETRNAEARIAAINVEALASLTPENVFQWQVDLTIKRFDVWARRTLLLVFGHEESVEAYRRWLLGYANEWIRGVEGVFKGAPHGFPLDAIMFDVRNGLGKSVQIWMGHARQRATTLAAAAGARKSSESTRPPHRPVDKAVIRWRKQTIRAYRDKHDLTALAFARKAGIGGSSISGIVNENRKKFGPSAQRKLLEHLGISESDWYRDEIS